ncbi:MAG: hypothetical protein ACI85K_000042 [Hyphomicrobiaceae bacterium]|jgi:hypothetical protein
MFRLAISTLLRSFGCSLVVLLPTAIATGQCTYSFPVNAFAGGCDDAVSVAVFAPDGDLIAGGRFLDAGGVAANRIARWNGTTWSTFGGGLDGEVVTLAALANGDVIAGGYFITSGGVATNCIARWDGTAWTSLGTGMTGAAPFGCSVQSIAETANGDLIVGGFFTTAGGVAANNIARWNGSNWSALDTGLDGTVRAVLVRSNGQIVAGGGFATAGGVVVNHLASWNGSNWAAIGAGLGSFSGATSLAEDTNGAVYVGGIFLNAGGIAASGIAQVYPSWAALGTGTNLPVTSILPLPTGDLVVGGLFSQAGGVSANRVARWDGSGWSALGGGTDDLVQGFALDSSGDVIAVGQFTNTSTSAAGRITRIVSSCAPQVVSIGAGCNGTGGLNELFATAAPLIGSTFKATGTGMASTSWVLAVSGLQQFAVPLSALLPQSFPGCTVFTDTVVSQLVFPVGGQAQTSLLFPIAPNSVGLSFYHQCVSLELDAQLNLTGISSTNALQVTIGTF